MHLTGGCLYWNKKDKIKKIYPYITKNEKCDVLVIGGGITGAITAYFLAKEGMNVILVDKNIIGYGSTSATTALLEYQVDIDLHKLDKIIGRNNSKKIYELCLDAINDIEEIDSIIGKKNEFRRRNAMYFTNKLIQRGNIVKEYEARKYAGFDVSFIDDNSSINLNSAIVTKNGSGDINPYKFTINLVEYLNGLNNVRVYENTEIKNIKFNYDDKITCITNNKFKINADKVIFCTGFETLLQNEMPCVTLYKTFTIVTKPIQELSKLDTSFTARDMCSPYHYIRFTKDNRIIFGGEDVKVSPKMDDESYMKNIAKDKYNKLYSYLRKLFYNLDNIEIEYAYYGTFADTKDSLPIIDELSGMPGCFCNLGYGSNGILYSVFGAKILKDAVKGLYTKDINLFKINR